ncbi:MAG: MFS transporter, partial [bacterium]|nr:MFS transporter [bacterium]
MFRKLFQNRNLTFLWLGQVISQSGDSIYQIGLLWLVLELSGSETITGFVAMSVYLPSLVFSLFAGVAADRFNRRRIMITADILRTGIVLLIPLAALLFHLNAWFLAVNAFALVAASVFFYPARDSLLPLLVPKEQLLRANTLIQTSWQFSLLLGPAVAALLLEYFGKVQLFTATSLFYFGSFLFIFLIRVQEPRVAVQEDHSGWKDIRQGL